MPGGFAAMINESKTLLCQLTAIADFVCQSPLDLAELRALAGEFHHATRRIEAAIAKRAGHPNYEGMFG